MRVATTALTTVFRIGNRPKEELTALIGEAFLGWLVTDGYVAYRDHPRRQRCLAHYADLQIMPTSGGNRAWAAAIATVGSA
jgi:hypothetical protein